VSSSEFFKSPRCVDFASLSEEEMSQLGNVMSDSRRDFHEQLAAAKAAEEERLFKAAEEERLFKAAEEERLFKAAEVERLFNDQFAFVTGCNGSVSDINCLSGLDGSDDGSDDGSGDGSDDVSCVEPIEQTSRTSRTSPPINVPGAFAPIDSQEDCDLNAGAPHSIGLDKEVIAGPVLVYVPLEKGVVAEELEVEVQGPLGAGVAFYCGLEGSTPVATPSSCLSPAGTEQISAVECSSADVLVSTSGGAEQASVVTPLPVYSVTGASIGDAVVPTSVGSEQVAVVDCSSDYGADASESESESESNFDNQLDKIDPMSFVVSFQYDIPGAISQAKSQAKVQAEARRAVAEAKIKYTESLGVDPVDAVLAWGEVVHYANINTP
jgi:hypothetical protein